jgi:hypothetical protein
MSQVIVFASICPHCHRDQPQDGFTVADLQRLFDGGYPVEGYCGICDKFWPISLQERVRLSEVVAATYGSKLPPKEYNYLAQPPAD